MNDIDLEWRGQIYTIEGKGAMKLILDLETIIPAQRLVMTEPLDWPLAKLALAFQRVLRHVGVIESHEDVYSYIWSSDSTFTAENAVIALQQLMIPPKEYRIATKDEHKEEAAQGK